MLDLSQEGVRGVGDRKGEDLSLYLFFWKRSKRLCYRGIKSLEASSTEAILEKTVLRLETKKAKTQTKRCSKPCLFSDRCYDRAGKETCEWRVANGHDCKAAYMEYDCAATCGYCGKPAYSFYLYFPTLTISCNVQKLGKSCSYLTRCQSADIIVISYKVARVTS